MGDRMDKIERVARAMCQARRKNPDGDSGRGPLETVTSSDWVIQLNHTGAAPSSELA
jgi:hypothetical protein